VRVIADYHTHTRYSHGTGTIEENVISGIHKGLTTIAITDHGPAYCNYGINICQYKEMKETIERLNEKYSGVIEILLGIEANIIDEQGTLDVDDAILKDCDILLAGFHFDIVYKEILQMNRLQLQRGQTLKSRLTENLYMEITERNTQALLHSIEQYDIDIITHPGDHQPISLAEVARIAGTRKTALEINNFHRCLNVSQIKEAIELSDVDFVISSDAHRPKDVGNFIGALKIVQRSGLDIGRVKNLRA